MAIAREAGSRLGGTDSDAGFEADSGEVAELMGGTPIARFNETVHVNI
jgi:hypothetical protein